LPPQKPFAASLPERSCDCARHLRPEALRCDHELLFPVLDDARLEEDGRHRGGAENRELIESVHAVVSIDRDPASPLIGSA